MAEWIKSILPNLCAQLCLIKQNLSPPVIGHADDDPDDSVRFRQLEHDIFAFPRRRGLRRRRALVARMESHLGKDCCHFP